ncbi:hypothetical protein ACQR1V_13625 [Bradyrhizobium oligotrophicum]|uniref:hypothetical protein n=1 Tax=Bradyrhizobium oligotrophicum TaxID=44255 RepID=UPI003EB793E5
MPIQPLARTIQDFILKHIHTVAQMEALLFLHAHPQDRWAAADMAKRLYATEREIVAALTELHRDGFLHESDGLYQFHSSPERAALVAEFAEAYRHQLIPITNLIHGKLRSINAFSYAFKLRKDR